MKRKLGLVVCFILGIAANSGYSQTSDGSYLCVSGLSAGLSYDARQKSWVGTTLKPTGRFVLNLKYAGQRKASIPGFDRTVTYDLYDVAIKPSGSDQETSCLEPNSERTSVDFSVRSGLGSCTALTSEYRFNLKTGRFLEIYPWGYIDGADSDGDGNTPSVSGGTCSKSQ